MKKKILVVLALTTMLFGCGKVDEGSGAQRESTTSSVETTTADDAAEAATVQSTETTSAEVSSDEISNAEFAHFERGVYTVIKNGKPNYDWFVFYDTKSGKTDNSDTGTGVGFTCEQSESGVVFHFGGANQSSVMTLSFDEHGELVGTMDGDTYTFYPDPSYDPDTFDATQVIGRGDTDVGQNYFAYSVYQGTIDGVTKVYYCFYDVTNGKAVSADGQTVTGFTCEQTDGQVTFHMDGEDNASVMAVDSPAYGTIIGTMDGVTYTFTQLDGLDAATFDPTKDIG